MVLKNSKHEAVAHGVIADPERNGPRAYRAVYPNSSEHAAQTAYGRLLKKAEFASRIAELEADLADKAAKAGLMSSQEVLQELSKLGRSNMQNYIVRADDSADVIEALRDLPPEHAAAIQELTVDTYMDGGGDDAREVKRVRLKLHDKRGPLVDLGRYYGLFKDRHEHSGPNGGPIPVKTENLSELELARRIAFALELGARAAAAPVEEKKE